jgi:hypothetical protein
VLMQLRDEEAVAFLRGQNSVRDGYLVALSVHEDAISEPTACLKFDVPRGSEGDQYTLELSGNPEFEYGFCSDSAFRQIPFVKTLWTDASIFYISLDP